jgi:hypothetical protein
VLFDPRNLVLRGAKFARELGLREFVRPAKLAQRHRLGEQPLAFR